jgi:hypothetical protein
MTAARERFVTPARRGIAFESSVIAGGGDVANDVFVQAFERGVPVLMHAEAVKPLVEPYVLEVTADFAQLKTSDGGASLYGYGDDGGLLFADPTGGEIWEVVLTVARVNGAAIVPIGQPAIVADPEVLSDLPEDLRDGAKVTTARRALMDALGF